MHSFILAALISHGWPRHLAASIFLRMSRCLSCKVGRVSVEMMGRGTTTSSMVFECSRCGLERVDFDEPIADADARMLAAGRMVDVDTRGVN